MTTKLAPWAKAARKILNPASNHPFGNTKPRRETISTCCPELGKTKFIIITSIRGVGNVATVELAMDAYHAHDFLDSFQLLKVEGEWRIVSKLFHADPQSK